MAKTSIPGRARGFPRVFSKIVQKVLGGRTGPPGVPGKPGGRWSGLPNTGTHQGNPSLEVPDAPPATAFTSSALMIFTTCYFCKGEERPPQQRHDPVEQLITARPINNTQNRLQNTIPDAFIRKNRGPSNSDTPTPISSQQFFWLSVVTNQDRPWVAARSTAARGAAEHQCARNRSLVAETIADPPHRGGRLAAR